MTPTDPTDTEEHPMPTTDPNPANQHTNQHTDQPAPSPAGGHQMDSRMMWVMMIGCCLAIPFALIIGGASFAGFSGASLWLVGAGVVLAIALVVTRRMSEGPRCDAPVDRHDTRD